MRRIALAAVTTFAVLGTSRTWAVESSAPALAQSAIQSGGSQALHAAWNDLLHRHVRGGRVNYDALTRDRALLDGYLAALRAAASETPSDSRNEQVAFWINAYNAHTVALILDHQPVASIWDVTPPWKRAFGGPFALEIMPLGPAAPELAKANLSLNDVEHEILRKRFADARIHFALVCAARGCPPLASEAYTAVALDAQLDSAGRRFLGDRSKNRYDAARATLVLSPLFRWYAEDFSALGGVLEVFRRYGGDDDVRALGQTAPAIEYSKYDWSLNAENVGR